MKLRQWPSGGTGTTTAKAIATIQVAGTDVLENHQRDLRGVLSASDAPRVWEEVVTMDIKDVTINTSSGAIRDVLKCLFFHGPTWDGNIASKNGRGELCRAGLAWHEHGYASLTPEGVRTAVEWPIADLVRRHDQRWVKKRRAS